VLIGHVSTATTLLGNIAHKTGSLLEWDGKTERFTNNEAANGLLHYKFPRFGVRKFGGIDGRAALGHVGIVGCLPSP